MANRSKYHPTAQVIEEDRELLKALESLPDYAPQNPAYTADALRTKEQKVSDREQRVRQAHQVFLQAQHAYATERAQLQEDRADFHDDMREGKVQAIAQYGSDSPILELLGIRRVSQRRRAAARRRSGTTGLE